MISTSTSMSDWRPWLADWQSGRAHAHAQSWAGQPTETPVSFPNTEHMVFQIIGVWGTRHSKL